VALLRAEDGAALRVITGGALTKGHPNMMALLW
jgi:hypothetical protein